MNVQAFENDDYAYLSFLIANPYSYVVNVRKGEGKMNPAVHRAWCIKNRTRKSTDRVSPFTGQQYKKIAAHRLQDVKEWIRKYCKEDDEVRYCSTCQPKESIIPDILPSIEILEQHFEKELDASIDLSDQEIKDELERLNVEAKRKKVASYVYERSPHVVQAVLRRAKGMCEMCGQDAPFKRKSNGQPFLEVHHKEALSKSGKDIESNCVAVCPNCHREAHFG